MFGMKGDKMEPQVCISALVCVMFMTTYCLALQNIRIQVNNENLRNPPYLLEALKQASDVETSEALNLSQQHVAHGNKPSPALNGSRLQNTTATAATPYLGRGEVSLVGQSLRQNDKVAPVQGETIEELLDLRPDSVLRLSPESIISSLPAESVVHTAQVSSMNEIRKPQLPVTNSHLKRPVLKADEVDELAPTVDQMSLNSSTARADSRVSPSVSSDDDDRFVPSIKSNTRSQISELQDTWEAGQVMAGITNVSRVPATVRRQYGHQTRTRITLGGGYSREKAPDESEPAPGDYNQENKQTDSSQIQDGPVSLHESEGSSVDFGGDQEQSGSGIVESSRLVEVPQRIVLPVGIFNKEGSVDANLPSRPPLTNTTNSGRRDPRCPANGVLSLEHPTSCDKYFLCEGGNLSERTCPNGLLYGTRQVVRDYCVHRWEAVCGDKSIPNPISSPGCRWQNGIFTVQGSPKCVPDFYECKDGLFEVRKCTASGQVYDDKTKSCRYAELVGCTQEVLADFRCPADDQTNTYWPFPRYFLNDRALIHCVNEKPDIIRCRDHERVDPQNLFCVPINKSSAEAAEDTTSSSTVAELDARRSVTTSNSKLREKTTKPGEAQPSAMVVN